MNLANTPRATRIQVPGYGGAHLTDLFGGATFPAVGPDGRVEITLTDGSRVVEEIAVADAHPLGAAPFGREQYVAKFRMLADGVLAPGEHPFTLSGARLPAGVYFVRLETGRQSETLKLLHVE